MPEELEEENRGQNIRKAAYLVGGTGLSIWGVSVLISILSIIIILAEAFSASSSVANGSGLNLPNSPAAETEFLGVIAVLVLVLYLIASVFIVTVGARLATQTTSRRLTYIVIAMISLADILLGAILLRSGQTAGMGAFLIASSILAMLATALYMTNSLGTKVAGTILGMVAVVLFTVNVYSLFGLISTDIAQSSSSVLQQIFGTLSTGFIITVIAAIFGLVIMSILSFFEDPKSRAGTVLYTLFMVAPIMFGIAVSIVGFELGFSLSGSLSTALSQSSVAFSSTQESVAIGALWVIVISSILAGVAGILMVVGSGLGMGFLGNSLRFVNGQASEETSEEERVSESRTAPTTTSTSARRTITERPTAQVLEFENSNGLFCQFCGTKLVGDDAFCRHCGRKI